jgi:hypothetical protein
MRRFLFILVLALSWAFLAASAQAQDTPVLSNLEISLWPEFDQPEMLIIYRGLFAADTPLPLPVEFSIPASVGQPTAVAYVGEGGQRLNQQYTTRVDGDSLIVSFELSTLGFQLEYYAALPVDSAGQRDFAYSYVADYPISALNLEIQEPPSAQAFVVDPAPGLVTQESDGLTHHFVEVGSLAQGETRSWTVTYQKADSALTIESLAPAPAPTAAASPLGEETNGSSVVIFIVAFFALIAVGGGAFWLGRRTQPAQQAPPPSIRRSKRRGSGGRSSERIEETSFCHQCGTSLRFDAVFCHACGATVRRP